MKSPIKPACFALLFLLATSADATPRAGHGQTKTIHLRNQRIATPEKAVQSNSKSVAGASVGRLHLIQFEGSIQPGWRDTFRGLGVDLLTYVPDDTYIADIGKTPPGQLKQLDFVRWVGPYKPEHKVHGRVLDKASGAESPEDALEVRVLIAPRARAAEVTEVKAMLSRQGGETRLSRGMILSGRIQAGQLDRLANSDAVLWIESAPQMQLFDEEAAKIVGGDDGFRSTPTLTQQSGYDGSGVVVSVADTGLDSGNTANMHPDLAGRVDGLFQYGSLSDASDEHSHGTHVAGIVAGNAAAGESDEFGALYGLGVASGAHIVAQRIFDGIGQFQAPPTFETLTRDAVNAGADIGNNSWGEDNQGSYDISAMEFDALVRDADSLTPGDQPYILEFSAGNSGPGNRTVGTPAVAKNVIASGACQNNRFEFLLYPDGPEAMADFSSRGPCEDGRIKPDVTAPGTWIASLRSVFADDDNAWSGISQNYMYQGGTSQAGPQVSGAAAVFVQYYRAAHGGATPSPALVKAALVNCSVDMDDDYGTAAIPNNAEGWGRVDLTRVIGSPRTTLLIEQTNLLVTGASYESVVVVEDSSEPLKITLVYTDVPGFPGAVPALVNDLNLEVIAPDGTLYRGNQLANGDAIPNPASADTLNNVEGVHLLSPQPGEYRVTVYARSISEDARAETGAVDQDFALVMSSLFLPPGKSFVYMNRPAYTAPDQITVGVIDRDQAGQSTVVIDVSSDTETGGEAVTLWAAGGAGVFTNTIPTATGSSTTDGQLQVTHDDALTASYFDASAGVLRSASATADLVAPLVTGVNSANQFGRATIQWSTDEPATSRLDYGTNTTPDVVVSTTTRTTSHAISLETLLPGVTYYYRVVATDIAGNSATNDNGGNLFSLVAPNVPPVLLVDGHYEDFLFGTIPPTGYTDPLNAIGVSYDVWDHLLEGSPTLTDISPYRVVIWRVPEANISSYPTFSPAEQTAIADYLDAGGAFFVASMDLMTRLTEVNAGAFLSEVLRVASYSQDAGVTSMTGVSDDLIGDSIALANDYTVYFGFDISDTLTPTAEAVGIFTEDNSGEFTGLRFPGPGVDAAGRLVVLGFPFDSIPAAGAAPNNRSEVLRRILQFLSPGITGEAAVSLDRSSYTLPSIITVEVGDVDLEGAGNLTLTALSTTEPVGKPLVLAETSRRGVFRGQIQLVDGTASPSTNQLRAVEGDTLTFRLFDPTLPGNVDATATVDVTAPLISGVGSEASYSTAEISWTTDEACDSLVQFGESLPLPTSRTVFSPKLTTSHTITLPGLDPTRAYFYQVVSRDAAGNTVVSDNGGSYYTFTTLTPLAPPVTTSFEAGTTNWSVYSEDYTESEWTLGPPNNGVETSAHSPVNAWGSMLNGGSMSLIDTFLASPAIQLTGGNQATLRFWHSHEFFVPGAEDILGGGEVVLVEVGSRAETRLALYQDNNSGWEQESIDLTPYLGKVVYLVWHHQLFSFDYVPRGGWLVDDVEITVESINAGTITVSNNLSQASFVLDGPTARSGVGTWLSVSNAPAGNYSVTFDAIPYHLTPPPQTNTLPEGGTLAFTAAYTFIDSNTNGISDEWENDFLGEVPAVHPGELDTDNDGSSDFAEFVGGTNPTNQTSRLTASLTLQPNTLLRIQWPTTPGRNYLLESSLNGIDWLPATPWTRANGSSMAQLLSRPVVPTLYRVQVQP